MDKVEIEVLYAQLFDRALESLLRRFVGSVLYPKLSGDEKLLALHLAALDKLLYSLAYHLFVHVSGGGVDKSVTAANCVEHRLFAGVMIGYLENAEALYRHFHAVIQFYKFHICPSLFQRRAVFESAAYLFAKFVIAVTRRIKNYREEFF